MIFKLKFGNVEKKEPEIKVKDIFVVEELPEETFEVLSVYDLCRTPFFYATGKVEMLSLLQSHSADIAITSISKKEWRKELEGICEMLGFRSSIYIVDKEGAHNSDVESFLSRRKYKVAKEGSILGYTVIEYERGYEISIIDCFNPLYSLDIFSVIFVNTIGHSDIIYCDVPELIDVFYHAVKNDKNVFMPIPFNQIEYIVNYLDSKVESETPKVVDKKLQIKLF